MSSDALARTSDQTTTNTRDTREMIDFASAIGYDMRVEGKSGVFCSPANSRCFALRPLPLDKVAGEPQGDGFLHWSET